MTKQLNCFNAAWNSMKAYSCLDASDWLRLIVVLPLSLMNFSIIFMSLIIAMPPIRAATPSDAIIARKLNSRSNMMNWMMMVIKYPNGVFQSYGNLSIHKIKRKKEDFENWAFDYSGN